MKSSIVVLAVLIGACAAQRQPMIYPGKTCNKANENKFVADSMDLCMYNRCVQDGEDSYRWRPERCALGSRVSDYFDEQFYNPCAVNYDAAVFSCVRQNPPARGPPPCFSDPLTRVNCQNEGKWVHLNGKCWCDCPVAFQGDFDCSKPTGDVGPVFPSNICVDGQPKKDFCSETRCLNNGRCYNQCDSAVCDCPDVEGVKYSGKRCEREN